MIPSPGATSQPELGTSIRSAYIWTVSGNLAKNGAGFVISLVLARLLEPSAYGLVGEVTVVIMILTMFQETGLGGAVVYYRDEKNLSTYFTISAVAGLIFASLIFAGAPLVAAFYHEPRLILLLRVVGLSMLISGIRIVSQAVLSLRMRFREIAMIETATSVVCGLIAVVLAFMGFGVWSLIVNLMLLTVSQCLLFGILVRPRFTLHIQREKLKQIVRWGLPVTGGSMLNQAYDNADYAIVGHLLGTTTLGFYTLSFRLATLVNQKISTVINRVSFPSFSAMQHDRPRLVEHWFSLTSKLTLINFPLLVALAMNAEDFLAVVVGPKWLPAAMPLRFLCMVGAMKTITPVICNLMSACGHPNIVLRYSLLNAVVLPVSFYVGCHFGGLVGIGIAWCVMYPLDCIYLLYKALRLLDTTFREYLAGLRFPLLVSAACAAAMLPASLLPGGFLRLFVRSFLGLLCYALCLLSRPEIRSRAEGLLQKLRAFPNIMRSTT